VFEPAEFVTTTLAVPAVPAGVVAVIVVSLTKLKLCTAAPPMVTPVTPVKPLPLMVTLVPPAVDPELGEMPVTLGVTAAGVQLIVQPIVPVLLPPMSSTFTETDTTPLGRANEPEPLVSAFVKIRVVAPLLY
jgi:hypothetical protein